MILNPPDNAALPPPRDALAASAAVNGPRSAHDDLERSYLGTCQKLEELLERKKRLVEEPDNVASLHQELDMIGSRIQRDPNDQTQDDDYLAVLRRAKECLWRRLESEHIRSEFQALHFELLGLGQRLGYERNTFPQRRASPAPTPISMLEKDDSLDYDSTDASLDAVERQIAELQNRIRSLQRP